ncbi:MAG: hypothetical protein A2X97_12640 [Bdellovibrionales bacterium GWA1_52_35]|nr:MAG: hypothetical protein A2X97_12640 [Bdellovibrionales bacterium GWA1_52_35]
MFWFGQIVSQLGDRIHTLAVIWLVYLWTKSGTALAVVLIASTLPSILISPWAGSITDRMNRKYIAIASDLARSALVISLIALNATSGLNLWTLALITALIAVASAFFNPATFAIIPSIVAPEQLVRANAISQLSTSASAALGFMIGSGLIAGIGVSTAFAFNAVSFLISAAMIRKISYSQTRQARSLPFYEEFKAGFGVIRGIPLVTKILLPVVLINLVFSALPVLIPFFGEGTFQAGSAGVGFLMASFTAGMFMGAAFLSYSSFNATIGRVMVVGLGIVGAAFVIMGIFAYLPIFLATLALIGFSLNFVNICLLGLFQRVVPTDVRGKFFSFLTAISLSSQPISYGLTGWLADTIKPELILLVCGVAIIMIALWLLRVKELGLETIRGVNA